MKSSAVGKSISKAEVTNISAHGLWVLVREKEYFLSYGDFPWFKNAKVSEILDLHLTRGGNLRWPQLDADLELSSLENLDAYPLVYK